MPATRGPATMASSTSTAAPTPPPMIMGRLSQDFVVHPSVAGASLAGAMPAGAAPAGPALAVGGVAAAPAAGSDGEALSDAGFGSPPSGFSSLTCSSVLQTACFCRAPAAVAQAAC